MKRIDCRGRERAWFSHDGSEKEMHVDDARDLDVPEGKVTVTISATLYGKLLAAYERQMERKGR